MLTMSDLSRTDIVSIGDTLDHIIVNDLDVTFTHKSRVAQWRVRCHSHSNPLVEFNEVVLWVVWVHLHLVNSWWNASSSKQVGQQ